MNNVFPVAQYYGTEHYYLHGLLEPKMKLTDGAKALAEHGNGSYWLIDIIHTEIFPLRKQEPFMAITMTVDSNKAQITTTDGNNNEVHKRKIDFTTFREDTGLTEIKFYLTDSVLMLTGEY